MNIQIETRCPLCKSSIDLPYILIGVEMTCSSCGKSIVPEIPIGTAYPQTEYQLTFSDFKQLVTSKGYRGIIGALLSRWFGYKIKNEGEGAIIWAPDGERIDLLELHRAIQDDEAKRHELYNAAAALWR